MLQAAAGDGRLTADELDERLERALSARTYNDLAVLVADLQAVGTAVTPGSGSLAGSAAVPSKELVTIECPGSSSQRDGRWAVPERMRLNVMSGQVKLDFTGALITRPVLHIDARLHGSQLTLVTRPGIVVEADEVAVHGGQVKIHEPVGGTVPVFLRVVITGTCDSRGHPGAAAAPAIRRVAAPATSAVGPRYQLPIASGSTCPGPNPASESVLTPDTRPSWPA